MYHMINWFFLCSFLGYCLECVVLSWEYKKPVVDRGFGHGPFCIIYGCGALGANLFLGPISQWPLVLYVSSMLMATCMELATAAVMIRMFGGFWWDYSKKPFNYKGIICLESSIGWGFLGLLYFGFLNRFLHKLVGFVPERFGSVLALCLLIAYTIDFLYCVKERLRDGCTEEGKTVIGRLSIRS